jgi:hypothetical protein
MHVSQKARLAFRDRQGHEDPKVPKVFRDRKVLRAPVRLVRVVLRAFRGFRGRRVRLVPLAVEEYRASKARKAAPV